MKIWRPVTVLLLGASLACLASLAGRAPQARPEITRGTILVLEVDPRFARPRQVEVPVLFVGDTPAHPARVHALIAPLNSDIIVDGRDALRML